jgi:integrase
MSTLAHHWTRFRSERAGPILDWKRFELAATHYEPLMRLTPAKWTHQETDRVTQKLDLSPGTIRRDLACLRVFATWLVRAGHLPAIPLWEVPAAPPPRSRFLSPEEMRAILAVPAPWWFDAATRLAMASGQRIDAVLTLRWDQIRNGIVDFTLGAGPRQKRRGVIPVIPAISEVLARCPRNSDHVIGVRYHVYLAEWRRVCKVAGVVGATPHCIRHGVATALISSGVPLIEVSRMLGHSNVAITQRVYVKYDPEYTRNATERMAGLLK